MPEPQDPAVIFRSAQRDFAGRLDIKLTTAHTMEALGSTQD